MLKTKIIANNITNLTDARYYAAWYVDWLGFDLRKATKQNMTLEEVKAMKKWIEGPVVVGELDLLDYEKGKAIIDYLELEAIQVGMFTPVAYLQSLPETTIIKEVIIEKNATYETILAHLNEYFEVVDYFLIDFGKNNWTWEELTKHPSFNLDHLKAICQKMEVFLQINISPTQMEEMLAIIQPYGLSITGGDEEKVGYKSFEEVDELFERLEEK